MFVLSGVAGEKDRTGLSHESFLLMANSQSDMEDWVRAIRRVIWAPLGGGVILTHIYTQMFTEYIPRIKQMSYLNDTDDETLCQLLT